MNLNKYFDEIVETDMFKKEQCFLQHGGVSVHDHSVSVAKTCVLLADKLHLKMDYKSLIRGALLHDYFLYDWHEADPTHRLHAFKHPKIARENAIRDFGLNKKEENMILSHMFPLSTTIPKCKESIILCLVDKYCATKEIINTRFVRRLRRAK